MFIDFVPLLLINTAAGFIVLASFFYWGLDGQNSRSWVPAFSMVGVVAVAAGLRMAFTWPLPGSYNVAFGQMSVFFGILFLGAALALVRGWDLTFVALYGLIAGTAALILGVRIVSLRLTREPVLSGIGFMLSGLSGILSLPILRVRRTRIVRSLGCLVLIGTALIWARTGYKAYWEHLAAFSTWTPPTMQPFQGK